MTPDSDQPSYFDDFTTRVRRAKSWLKCAEQGRESGDLDVAFILYWVAFNAAFATNDTEQPNTAGEFSKCFAKIRRLDKRHGIYHAVRDRFPGPVGQILVNQYLFKKYWDYVNRKPYSEDWQEHFDRERNDATDAMAKPSEENTKKILPILFERLYTLRNQIVHGGATWKSRYNRSSVEHGVPIMAFLVPLFIRIIEQNPGVKWGTPYYRPGLQGKTNPE